jgi:hypothetical protein
MIKVCQHKCSFTLAEFRMLVNILPITMTFSNHLKIHHEYELYRFRLNCLLHNLTNVAGLPIIYLATQDIFTTMICIPVPSMALFDLILCICCRHVCLQLAFSFTDTILNCEHQWSEGPVLLPNFQLQFFKYPGLTTKFQSCFCCDVIYSYFCLINQNIS